MAAMQDLQLSLAQMAPKLGLVEANVEQHLKTIDAAVQAGSRLLVFPELSLSGYVLLDQTPDVALTLEDARWRPLLDASKRIDLVVGCVEEAPGHKYFNSAVYLSGGEMIHVHRKIYLPTYGLFFEKRDFAPGDTIRRFDSPWGPAGMLVCEDLWHASCPWLLAQQGAEAMIVLSNGPTRGAKPGRGVTSVAVWRELLQTTAQFQTSWMIFCNRVGCEDGLTFGGGSMVVDPFGRVVEEAPALDEALLHVSLVPMRPRPATSGRAPAPWPRAPCCSCRAPGLWYGSYWSGRWSERS